MKTIIATFASQTAAKQAEEELRDAGFVAVSIEAQVAANDVDGATRDEGRHDTDEPNEPLEHTEVIGLAGVNNSTIGVASTPVGMPVGVALVEGNEGTTRARLTLKTNDHWERAIKIINDYGGMMDNERGQVASSTLDEVANAAQAPDRLK